MVVKHSIHQIDLDFTTIHAEGGVYALLISLDKGRTIQIGKLGSFDFPAGWYIYLGSAHGGGGVKSRTDRHRRADSEKRKRWNVDYFRTFAPISEIWFSHASREREHEWAHAVMGLPGASIPAVKFGANDCIPRCKAHFIHFPRRPWPAEFRAEVFRRSPEHEPVYTEFVEPVVSDPLSLKKSPMPILIEYDRGRRFLEMRRRAAYDGWGPEAALNANLRFGMETPDRHLIDRLAPDFRMSQSDLIAAAKYAHAVDTICECCEHDVFGAIFNPQRPQTRNAVRQLSRTSDVRRSYRIKGVLEGRFRSVAPRTKDPQ